MLLAYGALGIKSQVPDPALDLGHSYTSSI